MIKHKNDKYRKLRGGKSKILDIQCTCCSATVLIYQKDGDGTLLRCYLNRIFAPVEYEKLQHMVGLDKIQDMPKLVCLKCNNLIGIPMRHLDERLAFRLIPGTFKKKIFKKEL